MSFPTMPVTVTRQKAFVTPMPDSVSVPSAARTTPENDCGHFSEPRTNSAPAPFLTNAPFASSFTKRSSASAASFR